MKKESHKYPHSVNKSIVLNIHSKVTLGKHARVESQMSDRCVGLRGWLSKFLGFDKHSVTQPPSIDDTGNVQISN